MEKFKLYILFMSVVLAFIACDTCHANEIEKKFIKAGLVDIHSVDESIKVDLVNFAPDKNYFRENFYDGLKKAYLRKEVAQKLSLAQKHLKSN